MKKVSQRFSPKPEKRVIINTFQTPITKVSHFFRNQTLFGNLIHKLLPALNNLLKKKQQTHKQKQKQENKKGIERKKVLLCFSDSDSG